MSISFSNIGASFVQYFISIKWSFDKCLAFLKGTDKLRTKSQQVLSFFSCYAKKDVGQISKLN